jgi:tetratricopeptide (TPR) repeat protein
VRNPLTAAADISIADVFRQGLAEHQSGRLEKAEACYREILAIDATHADALHLLGVVQHQHGRSEEAIDFIRRAIAQYAHANFYSNLGVVLRSLGRLEEAEASYRDAIRLSPESAGAYSNLGEVLNLLGRAADAETVLQAALERQADYPDARNNLGIALAAQGRREEAETCYREALRLRPDFADAQLNLGRLLQELGRWPEAEACFRAALRLQPDFADAHNSLGIILRAMARAAEAEASYRSALRLRPDFAAAHSNLGNALLDLGRPHDAAVCYRAALRLQPEFPDAHANLSYALLLTGQLREGWEEYEWRWRAKHLVGRGRDFSVPLWSGEEARDRVILLHAEQGYGDTLHFCRYVPMVAERATVVLEVHQPLVRLLGQLPGVSRIVARGEPLPNFDLHCPLLSLPRAFGTTLETIPGSPPYLAADPQEAAKWRRRLERIPGLRVGLAWAGGPRRHEPELAAVDRRRSISLAMLAPLAEAAGVSFVSLQKGGPAAEAAQPPPGMTLYDFTAEIDDFRDTAALVDALDLVISVDTSVVHLAGALGKPVWLLNRFDTCWRWLLGRDDSPWYPQLRQFRQTRSGEWGGVIREAADALRRLAAGHRQELHPRSGMVEDLFRRGEAAYAQRRLVEAETDFREVVRRRPDHVDAHANLGHVLHERGQPGAAEAALRAALRLKPDLAAAHLRLGMALRALDRTEEAEASYRAAIRHEPDNPAAHYNLGIALHALGRAAEAEASYRESVRLAPGFADAHNNLGNVLNQLGRSTAAEASLRDALRLRPDYAEAWNNLGIALRALGRPAEAASAYREALRLRPDLVEAHWNLGSALLLSGQFAEGWEEHEWRWQVRSLAKAARDFAAPQWNGEPIGDRVILLHAEQGNGDVLQFCRYVTLFPPGTKIVLEVYPQLKRLLSGLGGVAQIVVSGEPLPPFDLHCPLMSLPRAFGTRLETIPAPIPYLAADPARALWWRRRMGRLKDLKVGLAWAGAPRTDQPELAAVDGRRSIALEMMAPFAAVPGVSFVSLQKGAAAAQSAQPPRGMVLHDFTAELDDFADTAALIAGLDLVISVDTAVVHLAGAMGKPVWLLNRFDSCWRWLLDRDDSPWYPQLRQFRQRAPADWASAIGEAAAALRRVAGGDRAELVPHGRVAVDELFRRGLADHQSGKLREAEAAYRRILAVAPAHADALHLMGVAAQQHGRSDAAVDYIRRAIAVRPDPHYYSNLGVALGALGRRDEAEASYREALRLKPDLPVAHSNLSELLTRSCRLAEAEASARAALQLAPDFPDAHSNLAFALLDDPARAQEAVESARRALRLKPDFPDALNNLGCALRSLGRPAEAEASFREAIRLKPGFGVARSNLGCALLLMGEFAEGWREYEWRWQTDELADGFRNFAQPLWGGEAIGDRVILLHGEQGSATRCNSAATCRSSRRGRASFSKCRDRWCGSWRSCPGSRPSSLAAIRCRALICSAR